MITNNNDSKNEQKEIRIDWFRMPYKTMPVFRLPGFNFSDEDKEELFHNFPNQLILKLKYVHRCLMQLGGREQTEMANAIYFERNSNQAVQSNESQ